MAVNISRSTNIFKDISLSFAKHPVTGDIARLSDVDAVKRSVRNLINTNFYERPFHPEIGSDIRATLFEPVSPSTANLLARHVEDCITNFEPRVRLARDGVSVNPNFDDNQYEVTIEFYIENSPSELVDMSFNLERIR